MKDGKYTEDEARKVLDLCRKMKALAKEIDPEGQEDLGMSLEYEARNLGGRALMVLFELGKV